MGSKPKILPIEQPLKVKMRTNCYDYIDMNTSLNFVMWNEIMVVTISPEYS